MYKDEKSISRRANPVGVVIHVGEISRHLEGECIRRLERSGENKHSNSMPTVEGRVGTMQPICYGSRQREKLLCLWKVWTYGLIM